MNLQEVTSTAKQLTKTTNKLTNINKLAKPTKDLSKLSKFRNGGSAAYWGYKAFQALRVTTNVVIVVMVMVVALQLLMASRPRGKQQTNVLVVVW